MHLRTFYPEEVIIKVDGKLITCLSEDDFLKVSNSEIEINVLLSGDGFKFLNSLNKEKVVGIEHRIPFQSSEYGKYFAVEYIGVYEFVEISYTVDSNRLPTAKFKFKEVAYAP